MEKKKKKDRLETVLDQELKKYNEISNLLLDSGFKKNKAKKDAIQIITEI